MNENKVFEICLVRPATDSVVRVSIKARDYDRAVARAMAGMTGWVVECRRPY